ncbi:MAG: hypothetical protein HY782_00805 [Chloroflexi bacterium]|nr:hypothetical protein [Chloroflexota bacterium]
MENVNEDRYQVATLVVVVMTVLVCMCYLLIFINPQVALNPFKPSTLTPTFVALGLQPTWTLTPTSTPTRTQTPTATPTITLTPLPTDTPTATPVLPTRTPTRIPPTRTPRPPSPPTAPPSPYSYNTVRQGCFHAGGTFIEGTAWTSASGGSPQAGVRVALGSGAGPGTGDVYYVTTGTQGKSDGYYVHIIRQDGAATGTYYVWIADGSGNALSDPNAGRVTINGIRNPDDSNACWRAVVDFTRR